MTIQSYEIRALDDFGGRIHWIPSDLGAWCPADSVRRLEKECADLRAENARLSAPSAQPDNAAVDRFAAAMKEKLRISREEKGRDGWQTCSPEYLATLLVGHLKKGDPVDIANFCMMLHQTGAHHTILAAAVEVHFCPLILDGKNELDVHEAELAELKEWHYSDQELAIKILSYLGFSQEPSKEPYADRRRDHIAEMICRNCEPLRKELATLKEGHDYKGVLFALCASLSLQDTIGDVWEDTVEALKRAGLDAEKLDRIDEFQDILKIMPKPVMSLYGPVDEEE